MFAKSLHVTNWRLNHKSKVFSSQNSCITTKLRDFLYVVLNHPSQYCRERPRIVLLKRKVQNLYTIITRICYRVRPSKLSALVFCFLFSGFKMPASVCLAGPGVFHRWLRGYWYWTQHTSLRRGQASAAAGGEMSNTQSRWQTLCIGLLHP